jgi:hypothetical protein
MDESRRNRYGVPAFSAFSKPVKHHSPLTINIQNKSEALQSIAAAT